MSQGPAEADAPCGLTAVELLGDGSPTVSGAEMCNTVLGASLGSPLAAPPTAEPGVNARGAEGAPRLPRYLQSSQTRNSQEVPHGR